MKPRFEVDTAGMRELQSSREPWQLAKELVSNAWDETSTLCEVDLVSKTPRRAVLSVYDDGPGFASIEDAWMLMKHTDKRGRANVRGRFNIGEKEILSVAVSAVIRTSGKIISFPQSGGRIVRDNKKPMTGTQIDCLLPWGPRQVEETVIRLKELLVPSGIIYKVNGQTLRYREPHKTVEATLETIIQEGGIGEPMRSTRRKTAVELHRASKGMLYEMGIPVQKLDSPWGINVMQKVPLPPNRDVVKDSYLQDIYTLILNNAVDEITDPAATWVRTAVEDKDATPEAVKAVLTKRYGEKVALWSTDSHANEKAQRAGFELVHARTLSEGERSAFKEVGLTHTSVMFPTSVSTTEDIPCVKWTSGMVEVANYARRLARALLSIDITVSFYCNMSLGGAGNYGNGHLSFNVAKLGYKWFDQINAEVTALVLHELSHQKADGHEFKYYGALEDIAGKAVHLALEHPEVFKNGYKEGK